MQQHTRRLSGRRRGLLLLLLLLLLLPVLFENRSQGRHGPRRLAGRRGGGRGR
jgi:hypothetical protein